MIEVAFVETKLGTLPNVLGETPKNKTCFEFCHNSGGGIPLRTCRDLM